MCLENRRWEVVESRVSASDRVSDNAVRPLIFREKPSKGAWWMPWGNVPKKDAASGDTPRGAASKL